MRLRVCIFFQIILFRFYLYQFLCFSQNKFYFDKFNDRHNVLKNVVRSNDVFCFLLKQSNNLLNILFIQFEMN